MFDLARLATVQLVPLTPFSADGKRLLPEALDRQVRESYVAGIRVFIPAAGTGEFHSLSAADRRQGVHDRGGQPLPASDTGSVPLSVERRHGGGHAAVAADPAD